MARKGKAQKKPPAARKPYRSPENPFAGKDRHAPRKIKAAEPTPEGCFPASVCNRLRHLARVRNEALRERADLFKARDGAKAELDETGKTEKAKRERLEADVGRAVMEIERRQKTIRWSESECFTTIKRGDEPELFDDDEKPEPPPSLFEHKPPADKKDAASVGDEEAEDEEEPEQQEPEEGSDAQYAHLSASVNELDCREDLKGKLIAKGITTVGRLKMYLDRDTDMVGVLNVGQEQVSEIKRALKDYLKAQQDAQEARDKETVQA